MTTALDLLLQRLQTLHDEKHGIELKIKRIKRLIHNRQVGAQRSKLQHWNQFFDMELTECSWCGTRTDTFIGTLCYNCNLEFDLSLIDQMEIEKIKDRCKSCVYYPDGCGMPERANLTGCKDYERDDHKNKQCTVPDTKDN